jgi:hypothetical protein
MIDTNNAWYLAMFAWGLLCAWAVIQGIRG